MFVILLIFLFFFRQGHWLPPGDSGQVLGRSAPVPGGGSGQQEPQPERSGELLRAGGEEQGQAPPDPQGAAETGFPPGRDSAAGALSRGKIPFSP